MATQQEPLLVVEKKAHRKSLSKSLWLVLTVVGVISSSALIACYYLNQPSNNHSSSPDHQNLHVCAHALHKESCLAHVSQVSSTSNADADATSLLQWLLMKSSSEIQRVMEAGRALKVRLNGRAKEGEGLDLCGELMEISKERVFDSMVAISNGSSVSMQDAHTWLSSVLTNHETCLEGLEGSARAVMEAELKELKSKASTGLAMLVHLLPTKKKKSYGAEEPLNGELPSWVTRQERRLLESKAKEIKANIVVAKDGSGKFKTVNEAVAAAPDDSKTRFVIYVKRGTYKEKVEIGKKKKNLMLVGDGMDATIITGNLNDVDGVKTFQSATVGAAGDGFIAQDIWFQNTAGPQKHQAVALRVNADLVVINRCRMDAFQDTLYTHSLRQFYRDSFITGTVDFIFGNAAVVFQNCNIVARKPMNGQKNMVTAQGREDPNQNTGTSIQQCQVTPSSDLKPVAGSVKTYLGRPWKKFSRTVFMQSTIEGHIDPEGWSEWDDKTKDFLDTLYYGEYMNKGAGAGTSKRVKWRGYHIITSAAEATKFTVKQLIQGDVWLKNTGVNFIEGL